MVGAVTFYAIKKLCMERVAFYIYNCRHGQQFLSNGMALWPVEGITLTKAMVPALFDINDKQQEKITINEIFQDDERYTIEPMDGEEQLEDLGLVYDCGNFYRALKGKDGIVFIDAALTKPGENKDGKFVYCLRARPGVAFPLVACYGDMLVSAIVMPTSLARGVMKRLEKITYEPLNVFWREEKDQDGE